MSAIRSFEFSACFFLPSLYLHMFLFLLFKFRFLLKTTRNNTGKHHGASRKFTQENQTSFNFETYSIRKCGNKIFSNKSDASNGS